MRIDLETIRDEVLVAYEKRRYKDGPSGSYQYVLDGEINFYARLDIVISYAIMGINID